MTTTTDYFEIVKMVNTVLTAYFAAMAFMAMWQFATMALSGYIIATLAIKAAVFAVCALLNYANAKALDKIISFIKIV
jgi:FtsH-binding integral membrane protein